MELVVAFFFFLMLKFYTEWKTKPFSVQYLSKRASEFTAYLACVSYAGNSQLFV